MASTNMRSSWGNRPSPEKVQAGQIPPSCCETVDPDWAQDRVASGLSSGEGLIWAVRNEVRKRVPVKSKGRHTGEYDEVVEHEGINDKRLLVMEGEFANALKVMQREGNTLSPVIRSAWDSGNLRSLTKNSPAVATGCAHPHHRAHHPRRTSEASGCHGSSERYR